MNCSTDPKYYLDPVLAECREWKAKISAEMADWEAYRKRQRETPCLTPDGKPWPMAKPEDMTALRERNRPPARVETLGRSTCN
jgi:hypothetical protein